jgi:hemoglobin/transferrin/lactoferrin receptor protein
MVRGTSKITGRPLNTVAPDELSLTVGSRVPDRDVSFGWTGRFVAAQNRVTGTPNTRVATPGFATHDIFVTWKPQEGMFKNLEADFRIENIFNKQYREFLEGTPAQGRTFKISLARKFDY